MRITLLVDGHCVRVDGPFRVIRFDGDPYVVGAGQMFYCESPGQAQALCDQLRRVQEQKIHNIDASLDERSQR